MNFNFPYIIINHSLSYRKEGGRKTVGSYSVASELC